MVLWMLPCSWNSMTLALWKMLSILMGVLKRMVVCMSVLSVWGGVYGGLQQSEREKHAQDEKGGGAD